MFQPKVEPSMPTRERVFSLPYPSPFTAVSAFGRTFEGAFPIEENVGG